MSFNNKTTVSRSAFIAQLLPSFYFIAAIFVGVLLRLYQITSQIIADDEWHALKIVMTKSYSSIVSHFGTADYCIPLACYYKLLAGTVGLSEMIMRFPLLILGMCSLIVFPLLTQKYIGRNASIILAGLLAISPLHIYFSRLARPYSICMFFAFIGIVAFYNWLNGGSRRWAFLYMISTLISVYFHLILLSIMIAPLVFALCNQACRAKKYPRSIKEIVFISAPIIGALTIVLLPPILFDFQALTGKSGWGRPIELDTIAGAAELIVGTKTGWIIITALIVGIVFGGISFAKKQLDFLLYLVFLSFFQIASLLISQPAWYNHPIVFVRYSLVLLIFFLMFFSAGLNRLDEMLTLRVRGFKKGIMPAFVILVLFIYSPLKDIYYSPNQWTNHALFQYCYDVDNQKHSYKNKIYPRQISQFYYYLQSLPKESVLIVEAPWFFAYHNNPYPYYQKIHRQLMGIGFIGKACNYSLLGEFSSDRRDFHFKHFFHISDRASLLKRNVKFAIFHKNLKAELPKEQYAVSYGDPIVDLTSCIEQYKKLWGTPFYEDSLLAAFDIGK